MRIPRRACNVARAGQPSSATDATKKKPSTAYDPEVLRHATERRKLVCAECMSQGLSPKDVNMYKCDECGDRGHRKFEPEQLRQHKNSQRRKKIVCTDCTARHKQIEKVLRLPKAWKCKCPGKGHDRHHRPENVKCDLVPARMGEKRWPGKNMEAHPGQLTKIDFAIKYDFGRPSQEYCSGRKNYYARPGCNKVTEADVDFVMRMRKRHKKE